jgi:hypothetical protein
MANRTIARKSRARKTARKPAAKAAVTQAQTTTAGVGNEAPTVKRDPLDADLLEAYARDITRTAKASRDELLAGARHVAQNEGGACNVLHALGDLYSIIQSAEEFGTYIQGSVRL